MKELSLSDVQNLTIKNDRDGIHFSFGSGSACTYGMITEHGMIGIWLDDKAVEYVYDWNVFLPENLKRRGFIELWNIILHGRHKIIDVPVVLKNVTVDNTKAVFEYNIFRAEREVGTWTRWFKAGDDMMPSEYKGDMEDVSKRIFGKSVDEAIEDREIEGVYA